MRSLGGRIGLAVAKDLTAPPDVKRLVDQLIDAAVARCASDIHVEPTGQEYEIRYRVDGLLELAQKCDLATGRGVVNRLMVMGHLLTYRLDIPQEGRVSATVTGQSAPIDLRFAIMPTAHGLRAAVRLPAELVQPQLLGELGLPGRVLQVLEKFSAADAGMLILAGPAGSGKTTTIYALLRHIAATRPGLSIISLEDPVERKIPGVTQIEVSPFGELTYERALRSILRQDPQVLMLGEIRDGATATLAVQAALSGHRMICTLHAAHPWGAIARLSEMGVEPYQITSSLFAIVSQRLVRRRDADGYRGRVPIAEVALMDEALRKAVLSRADTDAGVQAIAQQNSFVSMRQSALDLIARGVTDDAEIMRVLGQ
jgi:general secretion pathway protein E